MKIVESLFSQPIRNGVAVKCHPHHIRFNGADCRLDSGRIFQAVGAGENSHLWEKHQKLLDFPLFPTSLQRKVDYVIQLIFRVVAGRNGPEKPRQWTRVAKRSVRISSKVKNSKISLDYLVDKGPQLVFKKDSVNPFAAGLLANALNTATPSEVVNSLVGVSIKSRSLCK